jgi:hypothetical protein
MNTWNTDASYWSTIQFADVNGDGLPDVCGRFIWGIECELNQGTSFAGSNFYIANQFTDGEGWKAPQYYSTIHLADINGDGKADICGRGSDGFYCALSTGTGFDGEEYSVVATEYSDINNWNQQDHYTDIWFVDANGDGAADICGRGNSGIWCSISGTKTARQVQFTPVYWANNFGDNYGWGTSPYYWETVQPVAMQRPAYPGKPNIAFCGRGTAGIWCTPFVP